ncbi:MAG TPA: SpoIIE family protein phosphatase [Coriobacteriia bacterium]|nr:SpoIIE family protein phosphatase [Coriobacteriia bacterium]
MEMSPQSAGPSGRTQARRRISREELKRRVLGAIAVAALVLPIFILDVLTGESPDLSGLYLVPVVLVAYWLGMWPGLTVAVIVLLAELLAHPFEHRADVIVHAGTHAATYAFAAFVTARLRSQLGQIRELEKRRQYDLEVARRLQQSVEETYRPSGRLPFEVASHVVPARELGGDFVLIRESLHGLFVCIADISGHGIPAALFEALLQDAVNGALVETDDPEEVIATVNSRMYGTLPGEMFITMLCCLFSEEHLLFVNAGHEPALLVQSAGGHSTELCSPSGMPLGVRDGLRVPATDVTLDSGAMVLLFTDGITDSAGFGRDVENGRTFFESRAWKSAEEAAAAVIEAAARDGRRQPDDMSVVVVMVPANG